MGTDTRTLVIGASAAGLASAACLQRVGQDFEIIEASPTIAAVWRRHYDRLHLHTPKGGSALPGLRMPRTWPRYPRRDQVVEYLERYCARYRLQPHFDQQVTDLRRADGHWVATTATSQWRADNVVVATGFARRAVRPQWPGMADFGGRILHSSEFRSAAGFRDKRVLVVGFGNSACELGLDLAEHGAAVRHSVRSGVNVLPRDVAGLIPVVRLGMLLRPLPLTVADALAWPVARFTFGDIRELGIAKPVHGPISQIVLDATSPVLDIGTVQMIRSGVIGIAGEIDHFTESSVVFRDGTEWDPDAVVLGTGYRPALEEFLPDWRAVCADNGIPLTSGRPSALPGLYFCGHFVSPAGMLREIGLEARRIAASIAG